MQQMGLRPQEQVRWTAKALAVFSRMAKVGGISKAARSLNTVQSNHTFSG
jgi:hypothetical protein